MNPNLIKINLYKSYDKSMMSYNDIIFNVEGTDYNDSFYIGELISYMPRLKVMNYTGLSDDDINWFICRAQELYKDKKYSGYSFNMRTGKIQKLTF